MLCKNNIDSTYYISPIIHTTNQNINLTKKVPSDITFWAKIWDHTIYQYILKWVGCFLDQSICSKYGFCIDMSEGIIDLRLIIMLLVRMS